MSENNITEKYQSIQDWMEGTLTHVEFKDWLQKAPEKLNISERTWRNYRRADVSDIPHGIIKKLVELWGDYGFTMYSIEPKYK